MMQSFLIINSDPESREKEAEKLIGKKIAGLENNPDFVLLSANETSIGIDLVREMQHRLSLKPFVEKQKFCLISEAQNLTPEAQNALLKTLEEPPENCRIILTANSDAYLLPTIVSRCQIIPLPNKQTRIISVDAEKDVADFFTALMSASSGKRILMLEKAGAAKDKQAATEWLEKLSIILRQSLIKLPADSRQKVEIIRNINQVRFLLTLNANVRLVMENFLLDLPFQDVVLELKNGS